MKAFPKPKDLHEAALIQKTLREQVLLVGDISRVRYIAALDASHPTRFSKHQGSSVAVAVLWDLHTQKVVEVGAATLDANELFPYVPGYLSFRESPSYLMALQELSIQPELLLVDGQGVAHPRGFGIACHLGVHLNIPAIGIAKTLLFGKPKEELSDAAGSAVELVTKDKQVGWIYRSRTKVKPLYISPGHRVGMQQALDLVRLLPTFVRLPEPMRQAHIEAGQARTRSSLV